MHRLLSRQLRKIGLDDTVTPNQEQWSDLLERVSGTYQQSDDDRYLIERSLQTSSDELREMFQVHKATADGHLHALINALPDLVFMIDEDGRYIEVFANTEGAFMQSPSALKGKVLREVLPAETVTFFMDIIGRALETNTLQVSEYEMDNAHGQRTYEARVISTGLKVKGRQTTVFLARDITELSKVRRNLEHTATHDALTGLPNRVTLNERLHQAVSRARRLGHKAAVILMDLDRFKHINDSLGHTVGDEILVEMSSRLIAACRAEDTIFRFGGDEFVIVIEDLHDNTQAAQVASHFLDSLSEPIRLMDIEIQVTGSIGISVAPDDGEDSDLLLRHADSAMYVAKAGGRNQYSFFVKELADKSADYLALEANLRKALAEQELTLHYQPQFSLLSGELTGFEALIRWPSAKTEYRFPDAFIPMAEISGLIEPIGMWVIEEVCRLINDWESKKLQFGRIAINLSSRQLNNTSLASDVEVILERYGIPGSSLEFEITESMIVHDGGATHRNLDYFASMGIDLSIDDFGTGYSSLVNLKNLPLNQLKIDRSFVQGLGNNPNDEAITGASIALAKQFGFKVVAEGVETEMQADFLRHHHCDIVQGYLYGKPMSSEDAEQLILSFRTI